MSARRKWVPIAFGVAVFLVFVAISAVFLGVSWMRDHLRVTEAASQVEADQAFGEALAKFPGMPPLLVMRDGKPQYNESRPARGSSGGVTTLHVVAFNPKEARLARFDMPLWMLRFQPRAIKLSTYMPEFDQGVELTVEDLERYGPGVVLDFALPRGERALIWVE